ncbi:PilX N-terminal domain-containing pilus assembly protein [Lignipirellula cremea]|uniref:Type II secretion system protein K n=1 Tax=Lignipirellula cremea TaxID=2528010 RepID=A0A518DSE6_9BACT|nr:PilX N-terminal domain-containing pilus assembly protein [Lignipirellula cremea]QDU94708.1 hypothetical protein Pla8534_25140 [Lignipirellula cremea]
MNVHPPSRRGAILALALAALLVVMLVGGAMLQSLVMDLRSVRQTQDQSQAYWLAQSGLERARARLAQEPDFREETWSIPSDVFGEPRQGQVEIRVEQDQGGGPQRILVTARYGGRLDTAARASVEAAFSLPVDEPPGPTSPQEQE